MSSELWASEILSIARANPGLDYEAGWSQSLDGLREAATPASAQSRA